MLCSLYSDLQVKTCIGIYQTPPHNKRSDDSPQPQKKVKNSQETQKEVIELTRCSRPEYTLSWIIPGLKRPRLDYTRVYYGLCQFIPRGILRLRPVHTPSGQIIHP